MWITIVLFILVLSFLVIIHEFGHWVVAQMTGTKTEEFGLGYPPKAITLFRWRETDFTLNWIPFGGFVRMKGEDIPLAEQDQHPDAFYSKNWWQRLAIIGAGPAVNLAFGILGFIILFSVIGVPVYLDSARISAILPNSPAAESNVPSNVDLVAIEVDQDRISISNTQQAIDTISEYAGKTITLITTGSCQGTSCQELAQEFDVYVRTPQELAQTNQQGAVGVAFAEFAPTFYPWWQQPIMASWAGIQESFRLSVAILAALGEMVGRLVNQGQVADDLMGPVGIVTQANQQGWLSQGWLAVLNFAAVLSINLAIFNLLPIPALDGGRILFILIEKIIGKQLVAKIEPHAHYVGFVLLMGVILLVTARDIWRIVF